jgi:hypothetical protein
VTSVTSDTATLLARAAEKLQPLAAAHPNFAKLRASTQTRLARSKSP